ncbi:hypothetical protein A3C98_05360 [Candidatus Roizmanbacteria bacterium RIFCSPHIGHO2_02_FULL_37_15]|uniref:Glycosyl transferase n=1 Tax=Candidatus Roizmanbacteria bacterium RIFCSPLOWO2_01_FULL_37_16 TaxID=1802058 RepID=A0A1F7ILF7_9BACT|nr:MAG: hypothetical protein A2859_04015 [Candidatus Roizmanbacteria bacterium RIFCSPHIGHO2_01_FULL_37_16b]OGK22357.1 MAG: hypothetical protein A3C98_05360 [Candidatus Roizmanbacteria bacterium RIFCSPHIGHO2_02_FULL_37_15]OGK44175.1 MAG: hypothetical protein A3B40_04865 [Candidatus Roizmanbacteria bacterium RIFCSPLOWO2_01_FULL_37_16]OGK57720.1 MAG: hypothetical protein A3I50_00980 [Candidatus Roizmanbacteria bacterium RIFCSPLOWO2_02_FULL_37_9]
MTSLTLLGIKLKLNSKVITLEQIKKYIFHPDGNLHIVSINPENIIIAQENKEFKKVIEEAQIQLADGVGIILAAKTLNFEVERLTGVELMQALVKLAAELRLRVILIGGKPNLALMLADCYNHVYSKAKFLGLEGIINIKKPLKVEEEKIFSIVTSFKPHLLFTSFGSPEQELWLDRHKRKLKGIVCMGVGGAFDYLGEVVPRAPRFFQKLGFEWLFRLIIQPWRLVRQLRLLKFSYLVLKQRLSPSTL